MAVEGKSHLVTLDRRGRLTVSGVEGVERFDEECVHMATPFGELTVRGSGLHIEKLSLDGGDLLVEGEVDALVYQENEDRGGSFLARLFRG